MREPDWTEMPEQPMTMSGWLKRQRDDFEAKRAFAHAAVDRILDEQWQKIQASNQIVDRNIGGMSRQ
jgi:hypothetical protein